MTEILIHAGTHKTGSTTIQYALRETLEANPDEDWVSFGTTPAALDAMKASRYDESLVDRLRNDVQEMVKRAGASRKVVWSSEALCGFPVNGYRNSDAVFSMLRDATAQHDVKVVVYLRRQDSFVESMYTQTIHEGGSLEFGEFLTNFSEAGALDYDRMLGGLGTIFGDRNVIARSYHAASRIGLLADFREVINSKASLLSEKGEMNLSYSRHALEIARICNRLLSRKDKLKLRRSLQATMAKDRSQSFSYFTDSERLEFLERYQKSNQEVARRFFDGDAENLFPAPAPARADSEDRGVSYDDVARLVVKVFNERSDRAVGVSAGIRVALSGYPRIRKAARTVRRCLRWPRRSERSNG